MDHDLSVPATAEAAQPRQKARDVGRCLGDDLGRLARRRWPGACHPGFREQGRRQDLRQRCGSGAVLCGRRCPLDSRDQRKHLPRARAALGHHEDARSQDDGDADALPAARRPLGGVGVRQRGTLVHGEHARRHAALPRQGAEVQGPHCPREPCHDADDEDGRCACAAQRYGSDSHGARVGLGAGVESVRSLAAAAQEVARGALGCRIPAQRYPRFV
mmetsp:Transcript_27465/g.79601  ORF Transcript_27465/g.79601 Transcript_27465/m.79601 type:complete len:217 (+) Transcript_27465:1434-2084(+)